MKKITGSETEPVRKRNIVLRLKITAVREHQQGSYLRKRRSQRIRQR